jgi:hypothetical protein
MKVLTRNVKLIFECNNNCSYDQETEMNPSKLILVGIPSCPKCNEKMSVKDECLIIN